MTRPSRAWLVGVLALLFAAPLAVSGQSVEAAESGSSVTVTGTGAFADLKITVSQTRDLVNQVVEVKWRGGTPTTFGSNFTQANFLQIMQCWSEPGQEPTREQCRFGGYVDTPTGNLYVASRQIGDRNGSAAIDPDEPLLSGDHPVGTQTYVPYDSPDGRTSTGRRSEFFDGASTNEIPIARTSSDGTGQQYFEVQTGLEADGSGCGQVVQGRSPDCWLVVVPRGDREVDGTLMGTISGDRGAMGTSPLSTTNWKHRILVPLEFQPLGGECGLGTSETPIVGTELATDALTSWQPKLCASGDRNFGFVTISDAAARNRLQSKDPALALTDRVPADVDGLVTAPVAISALTIAVNIERRANYRNNAGVPIQPEDVPASIRATEGLRFDRLALTPRLIAKLLTQSYKTDLANGSADLGTNPVSIAEDPDFLTINPAFTPGSVRFWIPGLGRTQVPAGQTDIADQLWRYVLSDASAQKFLAGKPDPWGMVLNPKYRKLTLPTDSFPRADLDCKTIPNAPPGFTLPLCTLDAYPYADSLHTAGRSAARGDTGARSTPKLGVTLSDPQSFGAAPLQLSGERAIIALADTPTSARYELVTAALRNASGRFVTPTASAMNAAVDAMRADGTGLLQPDFSSKAKDAYPLTLVTYAATVPAKLSSDKRADYARLLRYAAGPGQEPGQALGLLPEGYLPLPKALRSETLTAAKQVASGSPALSPSPTSTPSSNPYPGTGGSTGSGTPGGSSPGDGSTPADSPAPSASPSTTAAALPGTTTVAAVAADPSRALELGAVSRRGRPRSRRRRPACQGGAAAGRTTHRPMMRGVASAGRQGVGRSSLDERTAR